MSILVFGQTGQVATELQKQTDVLALSRAQADLADPAACADAITRLRPSAVINAAAYTAVDKAEEQEDLALIINADAPAAMAGAAAELGIPFLHISTDYVFDGTGKKPWMPGDLTNPSGAYGRTKLAGENRITDVGGGAVILRTSWVFSAHGNNFVKTMLKLAKDRDDLNVVSDQIGGPTPAAAIAAALLRITQAMINDSAGGGIYHFAGAPDVSWADFAREIFLASAKNVKVHDIATSEFPTLAKRPANSRMDCASLLTDFGIERPDWRSGVADVISEL